MADLNDIQLSTQDILKKQFRTKVKGIDPDEVDAFLDKVIADYDTFEQIIEDLYGQLGKLQGELISDQKKKAASNTAKIEVAPTQNQQDQDTIRTYTPSSSRTHDFTDFASEPDAESSTNMAIIQRISSLERKVYNLEQRVYGLQK